ncbi:MAG TPA: CapA family protein [Candidatus Paceibacterota bacterium]|nr:CapA family protein [Candidatus Paceibacterota bacterium]
MRGIAVAIVAFLVSIVGGVVVRHQHPLHLVFVGDVMLSRSVGAEMVRRDDWTWPFEHIASVTAGADLTFGNLETPISLRGTVQGCGYCFRTDPRAVQGLVFAGFDVMSVANNHANDYGPVAHADTVAILASASIGAAEPGRPVIRDIRGTRVAFLAYSYPLNETRITSDIAAIRASADVVVVSMHDGIEYQRTHDAEQERVYHAAVDAGADLVVGSHPHVVQELERYHDRWIAYSLGNFVFDQNFSSDTMHGMLLDVTVTGGHITGVASRSVTISSLYQPSISP